MGQLLSRQPRTVWMLLQPGPRKLHAEVFCLLSSALPLYNKRPEAVSVLSTCHRPIDASERVVRPTYCCADCGMQATQHLYASQA